MKKSFSSLVKDELCTLNIKSKPEAASELAAMLIFGENYNGNKIIIKTTRAQNAARLQALFRKASGEEIFIDVTGKNYLVMVSKSTAESIGVYSSEDGYIELDEDIFDEDVKKRAFLRGAFIASGTITPPEKTYSAELFTYNENMAYIAAELLDSFNIHANIIKRKDYFVTYLKDKNSVSDFLNVIGAHSSLMTLMTTQIEKDFRNRTNRATNCKVANLDKTISASAKQCSAIEKLYHSPRWESLDDELKAIAKLRIEHKDLSIAQLGEIMTPPLTKSSVNRRLNKLVELTKEL